MHPLIHGLLSAVNPTVLHGDTGTWILACGPSIWGSHGQGRLTVSCTECLTSREVSVPTPLIVQGSDVNDYQRNIIYIWDSLKFLTYQKNCESLEKDI